MKMKRYLLLILSAIIVAGAGNFITAQQSGSGVPGGSSFSTQYKLNATTFGGTGPGTSGFVLTSRGAALSPTFQAGGGTPGGSTTQLQYNNASAFGGTTGLTWDGAKLTTPAVALASAGLNLPAGTAPTSPVNGDLWTTTAGLFARINGSTVGPYSSGGAAAGNTTNIQYNNATAFAGSDAFNWNDSTHFLSLGNAATPPTIGTVVTASAGTGLTLYGGDCSGASCTAAATLIRGGQGTSSSSTNGGSLTIRAGNADTGNRSGGLLALVSGAGTGLNDAGNVTITGGAAASGTSGSVTISSSNTGSFKGNITLNTGGNDRVILTGANSASTGVKFPGYGAGTLISDSSGNITSSTTTPTVTVGTFTVTYPVACTTTPTQNWAYIQTTNGTNTTTTAYPTDQVSCTSDSTSFSNSGGTQIPAGQRPIQEVVFTFNCANIGVNGACTIRLGTNGSVILGNSAFDYNGAWGATGEKDFPATNLGFPAFTYRTN